LMTGFSDRVGLGAYGPIVTNSAVVMRVYVPETFEHPESIPNLRWRGIVLDEFDGQAWSVRHPRRLRLLRPRGGSVELGLPQSGGPLLRQEIYLDPIGSEVIYAASRPLWLGVRSSLVTVDDMGSLSVPPPSA